MREGLLTTEGNFIGSMSTHKEVTKMKKLAYLLIVLSLILALVPAAAFAHTEDEPFVTDLIAGQTTDIGDVLVWNDADTLGVYPPGTVTGIDFTLEVGGSISGECMSRGGPLAGYEVIAVERSNLCIQRGFPYAFWLKSDSTSGDGSYMIGGLPTGAYFVLATDGCQEMWYNNKPDLEDADTVFVTMPDDTPDIDFFLSTAVESDDELTQRPTEFELCQNYPNPFNPGTRVEYTLKKAGHVTLHIYNILGEKVKILLDQDQPAGLYQINWDGKNDKGQSVSSGLYLYKLEVNGFSQAKRMLLLK